MNLNFFNFNVAADQIGEVLDSISRVFDDDPYPVKIPDNIKKADPDYKQINQQLMSLQKQYFELEDKIDDAEKEFIAKKRQQKHVTVNKIKSLKEEKNMLIKYLEDHHMYKKNVGYDNAITYEDRCKEFFLDKHAQLLNSRNFANGSIEVWTADSKDSEVVKDMAKHVMKLNAINTKIKLFKYDLYKLNNMELPHDEKYMSLINEYQNTRYKIEQLQEELDFIS